MLRAAHGGEAARLEVYGWAAALARALARVERGDIVLGPLQDEKRGWVVVIAPADHGPTTPCLLVGFSEDRSLAGLFAGEAQVRSQGRAT